MKKLTIGILLAMLLITIFPLGAAAAETLIPGGQLVGLELRDGSVTVAGFEDSQAEKLQKSGLAVGDRILQVNGKKVDIYDELSYEIMRHGNEPVDLVVIRNGEEIPLEDVVFPIDTASGQEFGTLDVKPIPVDRKFGNIIKFSWEKSTLIIRMCWESIIDLIRGRYSLDAVSGPVGISGAIGDAAKAGPLNLLYLVAMISINLGVMNLLPIPALDGGRIIFILIEMVSRRRLPKKIEDTINAVGLFILLGLSFVIMIKDIFTLIP